MLSLTPKEVLSFAWPVKQVVFFSKNIFCKASNRIGQKDTELRQIEYYPKDYFILTVSVFILLLLLN